MTLAFEKKYARKVILMVMRELVYKCLWALWDSYGVYGWVEVEAWFLFLKKDISVIPKYEWCYTSEGLRVAT